MTNYDSTDDNDGETPSNETFQRARICQMRELVAQSEDCWEATLSDDEIEATPLEWNATMTRRKMLRQSDKEESSENVVLRGINMLQTPTPLNSVGSPHKSLSSTYFERMSLPQQLLENRLRRKQRMHERHKQSVRYQRQKYHEKEVMENNPSSATADVFTTPTKPSRSHLPGNGSGILAASPLFPDEDFDDDNASTVASSNGACNDYSHLRSTNKLGGKNVPDEKIPASPLHSLPHRPICPFPDEADRKRIVGCLAAVLASSYAYETAPHLLVKETKTGKGMPIVGKKKMSDDAEQLGPTTNDDGVMEKTLAETFDIPDSLSEDPSLSFDIDTQNKGNPLNTINNATVVHSHLQQHEKQRQIVQQSRESQQRIISFESFTAAFQKNKAPSFKNRNYSSSDFQPPKSVPPSHPMVSFQHSFSFASFNNNISAASRIFDKPASTTELAEELAEIRHRIRRHAILSELLVSSAEMLMLDPSHAKAFLPMLEILLTKVEDPTTMMNVGSTMDKSGHGVYSVAAGPRKQSWKGRGFGGGGVPHICEERNISLVPTQQPASSASCVPSRTMLQPAPFLPSHFPFAERRIKSCNNASLKSILEKSTSEGKDIPKRSNQAMLESDAPSSGDLHKPFASPRICASATKKKFSSRPSPSFSTPPYPPLETAIVKRDLVAPFLQTLTPGAGFRCIALLLLNHLLRDGRGYDARVRQAFKRLGVIVISHELKVGGILRIDLDDEEGLDEMVWGDGMSQRSPSQEEGNFDDADELARLATRKFEAMEHAIAAKLISMSGSFRSRDPSASRNNCAMTTESSGNICQKQSSRVRPMSSSSSPSPNKHGSIALAPRETPLSSQHGISREQLLRGIKVGTAGAVGATLFALTGGFAAPGIAAGLAAVAGTSAIAAGVSTVLSSAAAITTIFGVGGAGLASYKMHRRTKGLTEFDFHKEGGRDNEAELFSTVCISGWLTDARDFQRPWGVAPSHPRIIDKQELLERFYFIHNPGNVFRVGEILKHWKGRYFQLWRALREKYGRDPSNLFPLAEGSRISAELTHEEGEAVDSLLDELGYFPKRNYARNPFFGTEDDTCAIDSKETPVKHAKSSPFSEAKKLLSAQKQLKDSSLRPKKWLPETFGVNTSDIAPALSLFSESETNSINDNCNQKTNLVPIASSKSAKPVADVVKKAPPKHLLTVWDYHANYGGELYTVQWESELLMELCDSVTDQMIEWGISATKTILHTTVFATLMTAVTLPYSLVLAANAIDSSWTMAMERADRAGVELAKSLIDSTAGHRPVILAGFSMGARVIYSCLKELARHQEIWEAHQQKKKLPASSRRKYNTKEEEKKEDKLKYIREPASIVEDAILMGTPNHVSRKSWEASRRIVAGRLINCYSRKDLILSLMFQMKRFQGILRPVCGTSPVAVNGVENYDVTDLVSAHTDYCLVSGEILSRVRHGQPQTASARSEVQVSAMVTTINVANKDTGGLASLSDETVFARGR